MRAQSRAAIPSKGLVGSESCRTRKRGHERERSEEGAPVREDMCPGREGSKAVEVYLGPTF